jgi:DmsE family decaheme c-type cytochrome
MHKSDDARLAVSCGVTSYQRSGASEFRLGKKLSLLGLCGLTSLAIFGFFNPVLADGAFGIAGINSTLPSWSQAANSEEPSQPQQKAVDSALSALTSFAQQIGTENHTLVSVKTSQSSGRQVDDQTTSELQAFAQRIGAEPAPAEQPKLIKVARADDGAGATYVGSKTCLKCHASQTEEFGHTLMGRIGKTPQGKGKFECENCHGPGSAHVKAGGGRGVGGIISFRPNDSSRTAEENNAICLACHQRGARTLWQGSTHETRGLQCTNCHTIMKAVSRKNQLKTAFQPDTCFQCHKDIRSKVMRSEHMPLREGKMVCSDCHSPHGSYSDHLLKKATVNDVCFECHADKRGPFLWEHPPVVENCLNCHDPHGSINENMLKVSRPRLCQRCHNAATRHPANPRNPMQIQGINGGCVNCHSQFHGSNSPGGEFFLR